MSDLGLDEQVRKRNKKKLVNQNSKLHAELKRLQVAIDNLE
jgi:hypothetical protein